ncbi:MAG: hypothetical protein HYX67_09355 [Candidatus Melainabacteria bacterium]|nr:hypothetical protein [Candidatus Melainabacteria bacterium]
MKSNCLMMSIVCVFGLLAPAQAETLSESTSEKPLAFNEVNQQLLRNYTDAKAELHERLGPIVLCMGNSLTLIKGKERETIPFIKQPKHEGLEPSDDARQDALIAKTLTFLDKTIKEKRVSADDLQSYTRATSVPDLENAYEAVSSQLTSMDKTMAKWRKEMTPAQWNNLYVFIATAHMPRQELLAYQYFAKLLNQSQEGDRIVVGENPGTTTEEQGIDLLLTHILDRKIAIQFFNDPWRMHRDLLSDAGKKWLQEHKLEAGP